jgi:hypothetical protein
MFKGIPIVNVDSSPSNFEFYQLLLKDNPKSSLYIIVAKFHFLVATK